MTYVMPTTPKYSASIRDERQRLELRLLECQEDEAHGWCRTREIVEIKERLGEIEEREKHEDQ